MARLDGERFADLSTSILDVLRKNKFANESFTDAFVRLIGLIPNIDSTQTASEAGDLSSRTQVQFTASFNNVVATGQAGNTVVDGFLKSSDENKQRLRQLIGSYVDSLISFVDRWSRLQRGQQARRLQRLVGQTNDPFDPALIGQVGDIPLHKSVKGASGMPSEAMDVASAIKKINQGLQEIETSKTDKSIGKLTLQMSLYELVITQINLLLASIPQDRLGELGGIVTKIAKTPVLGLENAQLKLADQRRSVGVELAQLQEQEQLIITGVLLETGETLSLRNFLQGLSYLTNKLEYKCKNCKYLQKGAQITQFIPGVQRENPGQGNVCTFSFEGKTGLPTQENFSCKEVWGRINNDFWTASLSIVEQFLKAFSDTTKGKGA